jgi:hypothetical protein
VPFEIVDGVRDDETALGNVDEDNKALVESAALDDKDVERS